MKAKSSAYYQREFRRRLREQGLVKKEVWIRPENAKALAVMEKQLREVIKTPTRGPITMNNQTHTWTTHRLFEALGETELFTSNQASIELVDGVDPSLYIVMHDFGDLPIFLTVSGDQIIAESVLWPVSEVKNTAEFNEMVLRTHKYYPLSTISLERTPGGQDYYYMFGALSSTSILPNILFEIEMLAANVIQVTEAYDTLLKVSAEV